MHQNANCKAIILKKSMVFLELPFYFNDRLLIAMHFFFRTERNQNVWRLKTKTRILSPSIKCMLYCHHKIKNNKMDFDEIFEVWGVFWFKILDYEVDKSLPCKQCKLKNL